MKSTIQIRLFAILSGFVFLLNSCAKKTEEPTVGSPSISTSAVTVFAQNTATLGGDVTSDGGAAVTERGVCWSLDPNPDKSDSFKISGTGTGSFTIDVSGLKLGTKYYVRAFATNSKGTTFGSEVSFTTDATLALGVEYQGGYIVHLDSGDLHGFICSKTDYKTKLPWGCMSKKIAGALSEAIGSGVNNTLAILTGCTDANTAADICAKMNVDGYDDWFLPSLNELKLMYTNLASKGKGGTFENTFYWSSTQSPASDGFAAIVSMYDGLSQYGGKNNMAPVRAFRAF